MGEVERAAIIEPGAPEITVYFKVPMPREGPVQLATILAKQGYDVRVFAEIVKKFDKEDLAFMNSADVIAISTTTSTAPRAYAWADYWRKKGKIIVIGGVHATFADKEALQYADYVIRKEGEEALPELLLSLNGKGPGLEEIRNLSYLRDGKLIRNPDRELIKNLDNYPAPDFSLVAGNLKGLTLPLITSRGCPFGCPFCCVIKMFGRNFRFKSTDRVLQEIKVLLHQKPASIFIADDNFAANIERAKELCRGIIKMVKSGAVKKFRWNTQLRAEAAKDEELVTLMAKAGCGWVFIGSESEDDEVLKKMHKSQKASDVVNAIRTFHRHSIQVMLMFIVGTDEEKLDAADSIRKFAWRHKAEAIQILILTPLPGTPFTDELEKKSRILHKRWEKFDSHHCVVKQLDGKSTPEEIRRKSFRAMLDFFSGKYIMWHAIRGPLYFLKDIKRGLSFRSALGNSFFLASIGVFANYHLRKELRKEI